MLEEWLWSSGPVHTHTHTHTLTVEIKLNNSLKNSSFQRFFIIKNDNFYNKKSDKFENIFYRSVFVS